MSRICGSTETKSGKSCTQVVEDHNDHCEAGHSCPPVKVSPNAKNASLSAKSETFEVEDLAVVSQAEVDATFSQKTSDQMRGLRRLGKVVANLGSPKSKYLGTMRGEHKMLVDATEGTFADVPHRLDLFDIEAVLLARGFVEQNEHWYVVNPCSVADCKEPAFVQLKNSKLWYSEGLSTGVQFCRKAWLADVSRGMQVKEPRCQTHRAEANLAYYKARIDEEIAGIEADLKLITQNTTEDGGKS